METHESPQSQAPQRGAPLIGAVATAFLASACCVGPLIAVALGLGSASAFIALEPYRPLSAAITLGLLGWAGWKQWRTRNACAVGGHLPGKPVMLWLAGALALLLLVAPWLLALLAPASRT